MVREICFQPAQRKMVGGLSTYSVFSNGGVGSVSRKHEKPSKRGGKISREQNRT